MRLTLPRVQTPRIMIKTVLPITREARLRWIALPAIIALAAFLRFANLKALGYANHYYTAAIISMLKSWHNFFFVAAEPGGSVSVDKPPVGLWLQAISAYFLGVNGFSVLLPQILAGILSVMVIERLVRRSFGTVAGLLAALTMVITPIAVATDRNNTMDSTLILTLLLATWAFIKASETGKLRHLLLGATLVGIGFNIKMLQAYLPLPAFFALYLLGSAERFWRKVGKLVLASVLLVVISLSWCVTVDLTPADQRPYVGSSGDNSELSLMIGYNGLNRLLGMLGRRGGNPPVGRNLPPQGVPPNQNFLPPQVRPGVNPPQVLPGGLPPQGNPGIGGSPMGRIGPQGGPSSGFSGIGQPGALRLFTPPLSKEASWLLPFAVISCLLLLMGARFRAPIAEQHQALVLWGSWLLVSGVFFSIAGFFHEYYLSMLAPPLSALVAIGVILLRRMRERHPKLTLILLLGASGGTLAFQLATAQALLRDNPHPAILGGLPATSILLIIGALFLGWAVVRRPSHRVYQLGFTCAVFAMLVTPVIWSVLTTYNVSPNQSLPSAYAGGTIVPVNIGGLQVNQALLNFLAAHTQGMKYLMAVPSSMQGADYIIATGRPVLYIGGFNGQDQVVTADELAWMVLNGELRFVYLAPREGNMAVRSDITSWVTSVCKAVPGFNTATRNMGPPDGTASGANSPGLGQNSRFFPAPGGMQISLYDCESYRTGAQRGIAP